MAGARLGVCEASRASTLTGFRNRGASAARARRGSREVWDRRLQLERVAAARTVVLHVGRYSSRGCACEGQSGSRNDRLRVHAGAESSMGERRDPKRLFLIAGYSGLLLMQVTWLLSGLLGSWAFGAWPYGRDAGYYFLGFSETTAAVVPQLVVSFSLRSAAQRDRLSGTTFKIMNASIVVSSVMLVVAEAAQAMSEGGFGFKLICAIIGGTVSALALREHGLPKLKLSLEGAELPNLARMYLVLSAVLLAAVAAASLGSIALSNTLSRLTSDVVLESHHFLTYSALIIVQCGALHTLQSAASAGRKRLASATYKKLNLGGILSSVMVLLGVLWAIKMECRMFFTFALLAIYNVVQAVTCAYGYAVGASYDA